VKPRIFISCVSPEFRTLRANVSQVLQFLGYEPEFQEIFGTEAGDLREVLRDKIDACGGIVHIVGEGYGAEPPVGEERETVGAEETRCSYTQFEFLYAHAQGKKTWVLLAGPGAPRDTPPEQLDLPTDTPHADPGAYQAERRALQAAYRAQLEAGSHLWHAVNSTAELENAVLKLRNDSEELRRDFQLWQTGISQSQARLETGQRQQHRVIGLVLIVLFLVLTASAGAFWWLKTRGFDELADKHDVDELQNLLEQYVETRAREIVREEDEDLGKGRRISDARLVAVVLDAIAVVPRNEDLKSLLTQLEVAVGQVSKEAERLSPQVQSQLKVGQAILANERGDHTTATSLLEEVRAEIENEYFLVQSNLGISLHKQHRFAEAGHHLEIANRVRRTDYIRAVLVINSLMHGNQLRSRDQHSESISVLERAYTLAKLLAEESGEEKGGLALICQQLGQSYQEADRHTDAARSFREGQKCFEDSDDPDLIMLASLQEDLAEAELARGRFKEAVDSYSGAIQNLERTLEIQKFWSWEFFSTPDDLNPGEDPPSGTEISPHEGVLGIWSRILPRRAEAYYGMGKRGLGTEDVCSSLDKLTDYSWEHSQPPWHNLTVLFGTKLFARAVRNATTEQAQRMIGDLASMLPLQIKFRSDEYDDAIMATQKVLAFLLLKLLGEMLEVREAPRFPEESGLSRLVASGEEHLRGRRHESALHAFSRALRELGSEGDPAVVRFITERQNLCTAEAHVDQALEQAASKSERAASMTMGMTAFESLGEQDSNRYMGRKFCAYLVLAKSIPDSGLTVRDAYARSLKIAERSTETANLRKSVLLGECKSGLRLLIATHDDAWNWDHLYGWLLGALKATSMDAVVGGVAQGEDTEPSEEGIEFLLANPAGALLFRMLAELPRKEWKTLQVERAEKLPAETPAEPHNLYYELASAYFENQQFSSAYQAQRKALKKLESEGPEVHREYSDRYNRMESRIKIAMLGESLSARGPQNRLANLRSIARRQYELLNSAVDAAERAALKDELRKTHDIESEVLLTLGSYDEAIGAQENSISMTPDGGHGRMSIHERIAEIRLEQSKRETEISLKIRHCDEARRIFGDLVQQGSVHAIVSLADAMILRSKLAQAGSSEVAVLEQAIETLSPLFEREEEFFKEARDDARETFVAALKAAAWRISTCSSLWPNKLDDAQKYAARAGDLTEERDASVIATIAAIHARRGAFEQAVSLQKTAVKLEEDDEVKREYRDRLELYLASRPYSESCD